MTTDSKKGIVQVDLLPGLFQKSLQIFLFNLGHPSQGQEKGVGFSDFFGKSIKFGFCNLIA